MEILTDKSTQSNIANAVDFKTTTNSSKLFSMLSSFLYSDKELAVLHELSSNAVDAHKMVGKETLPIEVVLPTQLSPVLTIRDHGPGLSHDNVIKFLTTYGESNKQDSNEFIGGYGIGSKSPAAVTDTWNIMSHHNGIMSHYLIVINKSGIPSLTKLRETQTEQSGLEVSIPVMPTQLYTWKSAAEKAYAHYNPKPVIKGQNISFQNKPSLFEHELFSITQSTGYYSETRAIIGNRGYVIDKNQFKHLSRIDIAKLLGLGIDIKFNIGELELDLSREKLRYSQHTLDSLTERFTKIYKICEKYCNSQLKGLNRLDYTIKCVELHNMFGGMLFSIIVDNNYGIKDWADLKKLSVLLVDPDTITVGFGGKVNMLRHNFNCGKTYLVTYSRWSTKLEFSLSQFNRIKFILNDDKSVTNRVRQASDNDECAYIIASDFSYMPVDIQNLVIKGTSLPAVAKSARVSKPAQKTELYIMSGRRWVSITEHDAKQYSGVYWTTIKSATSVDSDVNKKYTDLVLKLFAGPTTIIGVKENKPAPTFGKNVKDRAEELIKMYLNDYSNHVYNQTMREFTYSNLYRTCANGDDKMECDKLKEFFTLVKGFKSYDVNLSRTKIEFMSDYVNLTDIPKNATIEKTKELFEWCCDKYPLLSNMSFCSYDTDKNLKLINDYVKLVNTKGEVK